MKHRLRHVRIASASKGIDKNGANSGLGPLGRTASVVDPSSATRT